MFAVTQTEQCHVMVERQRRGRNDMKILALLLTLYVAPMTVEYTADGCSYLIDEAGNEWIYESEIEGEHVNVLMDNNGTIDITDDIIVEVR